MTGMPGGITTITEDDPMLHADDEVNVPADGAPEVVERRGSPRVDWPVTADLLKRVSVHRDGKVSAQARTVNVSLTGVLVAVPFACEPGEALALRFPLDAGAEMAALAQVVRIDSRTDASAGEWLVGCRFVELPVEERCRLAKFLMRRRQAVIDAHARATGRI
jgi:PilZ domain-containing protein